MLMTERIITNPSRVQSKSRNERKRRMSIPCRHNSRYSAGFHRRHGQVKVPTPHLGLIALGLYNLLPAENLRIGGVAPERANLHFLRRFRNQVIFEAPLLVHISLDHARRQTPCQFAVLTGLKKNADHNVWITPR